MKSRITLLAYLLIAATSLSTTFFILRDYDEQTIIGASTSVTLTGQTTPGSAGNLVEAMEALSRSSGSTIVRTDPSLDGQGGARTLYVTEGGEEGRRWLRDGYTAFSPNIRVSVLPFSGLANRDPRGLYLVVGTPAASQSAVDIVKGTGGLIQIQDERSLMRIFGYYIAEGPLGWLLLVTVACSILMVACGVVIETKRHAVQSINGWSLGRIYWRDIGDIGAKFLVAIGGLSGAVICALYVYNGAQHWLAMAQLWLAITAPLIIMVAVIHYVILRVASSTNVLSALQGRMRSFHLSVILRLVQVVAITTTLLITAQLASSTRQLSALQGSAEDWKKVGNLAQVELRGVTFSDQVSMESVGTYGNQERAVGRAFYAALMDPQASLGQVPPGLVGRRLLIIDSGYMDFFRLEDPLKVDGLKEEAVHILVPGEVHASDHEIEEVARRLLPVNSATSQKVIETQVSRAFQEPSEGMMTFGSVPPIGGLAQTSARETGVIVVVIPTSFAGLSNREAGASMANGSILFSDREKVLNDISSSPQLSLYVSDVRPLIEVVALQEQTLTRQVTVLWAAVPISLFSLAIFSLSIALAYMRVQAQRIWVQTFSGWSYSYIHKGLIAFDATLVALVLGWVYHRQSSFQAILASSDASASEYFSALLGANDLALPGAGVVAAIVLLASYAMTSLIVRRFVSGRSAR